MDESVSEELSEGECDGNISGVVIEIELESELPTNHLSTKTSKEPDFFETREPTATLIEIQDPKVKDQNFSVSENNFTQPATSYISNKPDNHDIGTEQE